MSPRHPTSDMTPRTMSFWVVSGVQLLYSAVSVQRY